MPKEEEKTCLDLYQRSVAAALEEDRTADIKPIALAFISRTRRVKDIHPCAVHCHALINSYRSLIILGEYERWVIKHDTDLPRLQDILTSYRKSKIYQIWHRVKEATRPT